MKLAKEVSCMVSEGKLIGSAPDKESMVKQLSKYFYSDNISLHPKEKEGEFNVHNAKGVISGVVVVQKGKRFRAEMSESIEESDKPKKPVNYTVKAIIHFDDGQNTGQAKVKAVDAKEAEKIFREKMDKNWPSKKSVEILSVVKG